MNKLSIRDLEMSGKRVFIRVDFNVPMDGEKVSSLLIIGISPPAGRGNCNSGYTAKRLGHLLASVQPPMKVAAGAGSVCPRRKAAPPLRSIRIGHEHTFGLGPHSICFRTHTLQSLLIKEPGDHEVSPDSE